MIMACADNESACGTCGDRDNCGVDLASTFLGHGCFRGKLRSVHPPGMDRTDIGALSGRLCGQSDNAYTFPGPKHIGNTKPVLENNKPVGIYCLGSKVPVPCRVDARAG